MGRMKVKVQRASDWDLDEYWILDSRTKLNGEPVFKFCYEPTTGKLWLGHGMQSHKEILNVKSGKVLDQVVRGIYFRRQKVIYLRDHPNKPWLMRTEGMLKVNGFPKDHRVLYGYYAAKQLDDLLEGL
jgi:hypothetical protein